MNEILFSLYEDIENNKKIVEQTKSILIKEYVKNDLGKCIEFGPFLEYFNCEYLGDICNMTFDEVREFYIEYYKGEYACNNYLSNLRKTMHLNGLIFKDEFKDLNLSDDFAGILLENISAFPARVYRAFYRNHIYTLGDLLSLDYFSVIGDKTYGSKIRGLGDKGIKQVIEFIHEIGFLLKNEENSLEYIINNYKNKGILVIEDIISDSCLCNILYSNNIYTVDDLKNIGLDVLEFPGIGKKNRDYLINILWELDSELERKNEFDDICNSIEILLVRLKRFSILSK